MNRTRGKKSMTGKGDEFLSIKAFLKVNDKKRQKNVRREWQRKKRVLPDSLKIFTSNITGNLYGKEN